MEDNIQKIEANGDPSQNRRKYKVMYQPKKEGDREIFADGHQYMRRANGSLLRITEKKKSKKERNRERRRLKRENENSD